MVAISQTVRFWFSICIKKPLIVIMKQMEERKSVPARYSGFC